MDLLKKGVPIILFIFSFIVSLRTFFLGRYPDFSVYYQGALSFWTGNNPYFSKPEFFSNYVYPPFVLLFFTPFLLLPLSYSSIFFLGISFASLFFGIYFFLKALKKFTWTAYFLVLSLSLFAFPTKFTLGMGQVNLVIFLLLSLCFYYLRKNRQAVAGVFLGLSLAIKLFPLLLVVYFLMKKQFKAVIAAGVVLLFLYSSTLIFVGWPIHTIFIKSILPGVTNSYQAGYYNQALSGFFARFSLEPNIGIMIKNTISFCFILISFFIINRARKKKGVLDLSFAFVITLSLLVNPFSWQHHFVWLILPFIVTFYSLTQKITNYVLLGLSYLFISFNFANPQTLPLVLQSHVLFGTILLWFLQARQLVIKK